MFEFITDEEERGQVGIGTLIVFIAMVLVAAIAAGVLINTAGFLQERSQQTGQEASSEVTDGVNVISSVGIVGTGTADNEIDQIRLTVKKVPGSGTVDLTQTSFEYIEGQERGVLDGDDVTLSQDTLAQESDRATITISIDGSPAAADTFLGGDSATLTIVTAAGAQRTLTLQAPSTLADKPGGAAVEL